MKKMNSNVFLSFVITLMSIAGCSNADIRQKNNNKWLSCVTNCLDTLIEHGTDKYGTIHSPMLMAVIDVNTLQSPEKPRLCDSLVRCEGRLHRRGEAGSNPWYDQKTIGSMYLCSELTGDKKYAQAADAYLDYFMKHCCKENDLFIWGTHIYWNCYTDRAGGDSHGKGPHEILVLHPEWHEMYRLNPKAVKKEIDGIWQYHICNKQTGQHNRHDDGRPGCDFAFSGGSFSLAFAEMYHATKEKPYLDKAKMVANWHWRHRNAKTGLIPDAPSTGERYDAKHCFTCVTGPYVSQLLKCYELTGDKFFRDCAFSYIKAYEKYGWDDKAQTYHAMLKLDGTAIPEKSRGTDYGAWAPYGHVDVWRILIYSYEFPLVAAQSAVYAYEVSVKDGRPDTELLQTALHWAKVIENNLPPSSGRRWRKELEKAMPTVLKTSGTYAENYGRAISFFVHVYRATGNKKYYRLAEEIAKEAVDKLYVNGIFKGHPAKPYYESIDGVGILLYSLIELDQPERVMAGAF